MFPKKETLKKETLKKETPMSYGKAISKLAESYKL
jgi:hypothetical protein